MASGSARIQPQTYFARRTPGAVPGFSLTPGTARWDKIALDYGTDADQILNAMTSLQAQMVHSPYVRSETVKLFGDATQNFNTFYQVTTIANFVRDHVKFVADPVNGELFISPVVMLQDIENKGFTVGDCDDHVLLLNSMLGSIGIDAKPVAVKLFNPNYFDHVISSVFVGGQWTDIDPCANAGQVAAYLDRLELQ